MTRPSVATVTRTVVVATYLTALAVAGSPAWPAALLGLALVAVWAAPVVVAHGLHRSAPTGPRVAGGDVRDTGPTG